MGVKEQALGAPAGGTGRGTALGAAAIVLWSLSVGVARSLTGRVGVFGAGAAVYLVAGTVSMLWLALRPGGLRQALALPKKYLLGCGALFIAYMAAYYLALGLAADGQQAIEAGTINYLWTVLTVVLAVPVLGKSARWTLAPGILLAVAGMGMAAVGRGEWSFERLAANLSGNWPPYALGLAAGILWALYSTLTRRWAGDRPGNAVPLFLAASGLAMLGLALAMPAPGAAEWSGRAWAEALLLGVAVTSLGYAFWETAMRRGNVVLVGSLSYAAPLLSALAAALYLRVAPAPALWCGSALIVAGAAVCRLSVRD